MKIDINEENEIIIWSSRRRKWIPTNVKYGSKNIGINLRTIHIPDSVWMGMWACSRPFRGVTTSTSIFLTVEQEGITTSDILKDWRFIDFHNLDLYEKEMDAKESLADRYSIIHLMIPAAHILKNDMECIRKHFKVVKPVDGYGETTNSWVCTYDLSNFNLIFKKAKRAAVMEQYKSFRNMRGRYGKKRIRMYNQARPMNKYLRDGLSEMKNRMVRRERELKELFPNGKILLNVLTYES